MRSPSSPSRVLSASWPTLLVSVSTLTPLTPAHAAGFEVLTSPLSTELAAESAEVRAFCGETRFYVARKVNGSAGPAS